MVCVVISVSRILYTFRECDIDEKGGSRQTYRIVNDIQHLRR